MTTAQPAASPTGFPFPDPPSTPDDKMTAAKHLGVNGNARDLALHLGNPGSTIVSMERYITPVPASERDSMAGALYPDLIVAFDVDPVVFEESNAYVISQLGKPPDFVLEIASRSTGAADTNEKRAGYAALGVPEYWRFDETGQYHGSRLAGDRLVDGRYEPIEIVQLAHGALQGHSAVLNLGLRWNNGELEWIDPATGRPIANLQSERELRIRQEQRADQAEEQVRQLEQELRRLRGE